MDDVTEAAASPVQTQRRALCLLNRNARSGDIDPDALSGIFRDAGLDVRIVGLDDEAPLRSLDDGVDCVIVGGGDGTINGLLPDLLALGRPVGILPLGTANDLAGSLGIPRSPEEAAAVIAAGHVRHIDLADMTATGSDPRLFANVAMVGFGTNVARAHKGPRKKLLGILAYPLAWLDAYRESRPFEVRLTIDDRVVEMRAVQVAVGSGTRHGGGGVVSEKARHDDGLLWVYYVKPIRWWGWLALIPALFTGRHRSGGQSEALSGRRVRLETGRPLPVAVDGELDGTTPADFAVRPRALPVLVPPPEPEPSDR